MNSSSSGRPSGVEPETLMPTRRSSRPAPRIDAVAADTARSRLEKAKFKEFEEFGFGLGDGFDEGFASSCCESDFL